MLDVLKSWIPLPIKQALSAALNRERLDLPSGRRAFVFLAADYGNIGDLAITAAQILFLEKYAGADHVVRIPISKTNNYIKSIARQINPADLVTVVGGGNMGSLYPDIEKLRQLVIRNFPKNKIVCFPQTLDWSDSIESKEALERIVQMYSRHPRLSLFARESVTQEKLNAIFLAHSGVNVGYAPDIVLSATAAELGSSVNVEPSGVLLCLRDDRECSIDSIQRAELESAMRAAGHVLEFTDTHAGGARLNAAQCADLVAEKINQFAVARLVVTDRLHGMILSILAGTPCVVLPNSNHKIYQTWRDWLSAVPQVRFVLPSDINNLPEVAVELLNLPRRDPGLSAINCSHYDSLRHAALLS